MTENQATINNADPKVRKVPIHERSVLERNAVPERFFTQRTV